MDVRQSRAFSVRAWCVLRLAVVAVVSVAAGGCALLVPHRPPEVVPTTDPMLKSCIQAVHAKESFVVAGATDSDRSTDTVVLGGLRRDLAGAALCRGFAKAEGYRRAYFDALRWNSGTRAVSTALTVPLVALAAREGLESAPSQSKIADMSVAAVVLYGWSTGLTSTPRQTAYLNGMQAMSCAMVEAQPLIVGLGQLDVLQTAVRNTSKARDDLIAALRGAGRLALAAPEDAVFVRALSNAHVAISRAHAHARQVSETAGMFEPLVESLAVQVSRGITNSEPSPQSLLTLLGGFGNQTRALVQSVAAPKTAGASAQSGHDPGRSAATQQALDAALATLLRTIDELNDSLSEVGDAQVSRVGLKSCRADDVKNTFKVSPDASSVVIEVGKTQEFSIANEVSVPSAALQGDNAASVEVGELTVRGNGFVLRVTGKKPTGTAGPTLTITDGTGHQTTNVVLNVVAAAGATPAAPAAADKPAAGTPTPTPVASARLDANEREQLLNTGWAPESIAGEDGRVVHALKVLQCVIGASVDGVMGKNTRDAIKAYRKEPSDTPTAIDPPLIDQAGADVAGAKQSCRNPPT